MWHDEERDLQRAAIELTERGGIHSDRPDQPRVEIPEIPSVFDLNPEPVKHVVENHIAERTMGVVSGEAGSGKTTYIMALAYKVAIGEPFAGLQTSQRPVLILDRENPLPIVQERNVRLGIRDGGRDFSELRIWGGWLAEEAPDPSAPRIVQWAASQDPKPLIIVDSLVAFLGCNENDATEVRGRLHQWRGLVNMGCTLILLHHSGKGENTKDYRGSSDIKASIDYGYSLANIGPDPSRLEVVRLRCWKSRTLVEPELILRQVGESFERHGGGSQATTNREIALAVLRSNPRAMGKELEDAIVSRGVTRYVARNIIKGWQDDNRVAVTMGPHNSRFYELRRPLDDTE